MLDHVFGIGLIRVQVLHGGLTHKGGVILMSWFIGGELVIGSLIYRAI